MNWENGIGKFLVGLGIFGAFGLGILAREVFGGLEGFWRSGVFGVFWGFWLKIWQKCLKIGCFWQ